MNKKQLVEAIADRLGSRQSAADAVDAVLDGIVRAVVAGERVSITGFGSFEKAKRPARFARNPQTGERVRVKETEVPRLRVGQSFKDLVSGAKKLPEDGEISVKKAPKGSLTGGATVTKKPVAKKPTGKKTAAKKTTAKKRATATKAVKKAAAARKATVSQKLPNARRATANANAEAV